MVINHNNSVIWDILLKTKPSDSPKNILPQYIRKEIEIHIIISFKIYQFQFKYIVY